MQATQCSVLDPAQLSPSHPLSDVCVCRESEEIKQGIVDVPDCCSPVAVAEHRGWSPAAPFSTQLLPCMQPSLETTRHHDRRCPSPTSTVLKRLFSLAPATPSFAMDTTIIAGVENQKVLIMVNQKFKYSNPRAWGQLLMEAESKCRDC